MHFPNGVRTIDMITLCLKVSLRMRDVTKAMDAKYSSDSESDDCFGYRAAHEEGDRQGTTREAMKGNMVQVITDTQESVPP